MPSRIGNQYAIESEEKRCAPEERELAVCSGTRGGARGAGSICDVSNHYSMPVFLHMLNTASQSQSQLQMGPRAPPTNTAAGLFAR
jgi:hypothetical protein